MENYLEILKNSRDKIKALEEELAIINEKISKIDKKDKAIHQASGELAKKLEALSENMVESDDLLNNAAACGVLVIFTLVIAFFLTRIVGVSILLPFLGVLATEGLAYILREKYIKRKYRRIRANNAVKIVEERDKFKELDKEHKEINEKLRTCYIEKYQIENSIMEEEQIVSEIIGYFAPLLDDLIKQDLISSSEYLSEVISRINT